MARHAQITQNDKFAISLQYLKEEVSDEVDFWYVNKHESLIQIDTMVLMGCPSIPKIARIASLQCLCNISKKKLEMKLIFLHADKHQSFYKLALSFLIEVAGHVQSTQNRKLVIFLQYIKKKVSQLLLCSIVLQNIQTFDGGPVMFVSTYLILKQLWNYVIK